MIFISEDEVYLQCAILMAPNCSEIFSCNADGKAKHLEISTQLEGKCEIDHISVL